MNANADPDLQAGVAALQRRDFAGARAAFERATLAPEAHIFAYLGLAMALRWLGDDRALEAACDAALEREPRNVRALLMKADLYARTKGRTAAAPLYSAALAFTPPDATLPADLQADLKRAEETLAGYADAYHALLVEGLTEAGFGAKATSGRFAHALSILAGKSRVYLQEPVYFYLPGLPNIEFYPREAFPWFEALEARTDAVRGDLLGVLEDDGAFVPYIEGDPNRPHAHYGALQGDPSWSAYYIHKFGAPVADAMARCPNVVEAMAEIPLASAPNRMPSVLFSLLKPGARIPPHHGLVNTRLICHLPLIVPEGCAFRVGSQTRPWREGEAWAFDDSIEHEAWNDSGETRVILLFDIRRPELSDEENALLSTMFDLIDRETGRTRAWDI